MIEKGKEKGLIVILSGLESDDCLSGNESHGE